MATLLLTVFLATAGAVESGTENELVVLDGKLGDLEPSQMMHAYLLNRVHQATDLRQQAYEVVLRGGRVIRLPQGFDPAVVAQLVVAVESC